MMVWFGMKGRVRWLWLVKGECLWVVFVSCWCRFDWIKWRLGVGWDELNCDWFLCIFIKMKRFEWDLFLCKVLFWSDCKVFVVGDNLVVVVVLCFSIDGIYLGLWIC